MKSQPIIWGGDAPSLTRRLVSLTLTCAEDASLRIPIVLIQVRTRMRASPVMTAIRDALTTVVNWESVFCLLTCNFLKCTYNCAEVSGYFKQGKATPATHPWERPSESSLVNTHVSEKRSSVSCRRRRLKIYLIGYLESAGKFNKKLRLLTMLIQNGTVLVARMSMNNVMLRFHRAYMRSAENTLCNLLA